MFLWKRANKRRDRTQETREGILDEIEQAELRGRKQRIQKARKAKQEADDAALKPEADADLFNTQENDVFTSKPVELVKETPIVPSTPVSMQPGEKPRPRVQAEPVQQPVQPITVRPVQPAEPKATVQAQPEAKPAEPRAQDLRDKKYDLDDILREIREGKL